jgi:hypothetical protein
MSRKNQELIDPSSLTIEQLNELIKQKSAVVTSPAPEPSVVENKQETPVPEVSSFPEEEKETKKCSYKPTRANQVACIDSPTVFYGNVGYCTKHRRTVQASNARKKYEEQKHIEDEIELKNRLEKEVLEKKLEREKLEKEVFEKTKLEKAKLENDALEKKQENEKMDNKVKSDGVRPPNTNTPKPGIIKKKIMPNKWGRFEDVETHILFDPATKAAYGVQDQKTGKVLALENKHITICKNNGWRYHLIEVEDDVEDSEIEDDEDDEVCEECGNKVDECICGVGDEASNSDEEVSEADENEVEEEEASEEADEEDTGEEREASEEEDE